MRKRWTSEQLVETFTLTEAEQQHLSGMVSHNQLGFVVLLKFFTFEGRFPQSPWEVPKAAVEYLASQLSLPADTLKQYQFDGRVTTRHRQRIRQLLGFRPYALSDRQSIIDWLCQKVFPDKQQPKALEPVVLDYLKTNRVEPPSFSQIQRLIDSAQNTYEEDLFLAISTDLPASTRLALDKLISPDEVSANTTDLHQTKNPPLVFLKKRTRAASLNSVFQAVAQLKPLGDLHLPEHLFAQIPQKIVLRFKQRVAVSAPSQLRRHPDPIRYTLLAAFCGSRQAEITDDLVECLIQIVHKMGIRAEKRIYSELLSDLQRVNGKTQILFRIAQVALNHPDASVKEVIYPIAPEQTLRDLVAEYRSSGPAYRIHIHTIMRRSYSSHYRRMLPSLDVLEIRTNNVVQQPVIEALEVLDKYIGTSHRYYPPDETVPIEGVVRSSLIPLVIESTQKGVKRINRINYEMCVLQTLRDGLRNKSIWVKGANRYRNPDEDLPSDFEKKRTTYYQTLSLPQDGETFISLLQQQMRSSLQMLDGNLPNTPKVWLTKKGRDRIHVTPLTKQPEPKNLGALKTEISRRWPMTSLLDILKETDLRVGFTNHLTHIGQRSVLPSHVLQKRLLLCLYGLGTNMGLKRVSNATLKESGEQYPDLQYVSQRYLTPDTLRLAIATVVNDTLRIRQSHIWGEGTTAVASDARKFAARDQNLLTEWHVRYHGPGVMVYWHVERHSTCIYSQLKSCSSSEVAAMIEGVLRHCTEMEVEKNYVDSHGQSEVGFAFCHLLGFKLLPRLKAISRQRLYRPDKGEPFAYPNLMSILTRPINWRLILSNYDEMVKYATALRLGTAEADTILKRFTRNRPQHPTYRALAELGKVVKTIFLCDYLAGEGLRREIHEGLNIVETWNSVNDFILYAKGGEIASNQSEAQELTMLSLHLLQVSLVYINTLMIQQVLAKPEFLERMTESDWRGLNPLIHNHVNPYGTFELDLSKRLPIGEKIKL